MSDRQAVADHSIVVVEDEEMVRELAVAELEDGGFQVVGFGTVDAALAHLMDHAGRTTAVFTDVQTPGRLSGLDLAVLVDRLWPGLPVLLTSGGTCVDQRRLPPGACFVPKPWRGADIVGRIARLSGAGRNASAAPCRHVA